MVLNSEFWEALTGNQRRKFAKANCEATYKKAITYQIFAAVLGMLIIGLFLPIADKARRYFKGYYSLREEEMPIAVKVLCALDYVFGLVASLIIMITSSEDDYGLFVNTLSRKTLEDMLNEPETPAAVVGVGDDPFRIGNFSDSVVRKRESKPIRKGCEKLDAIWIVVINVATVIILSVIISLVFSSFDADKVNINSTPTVDMVSSAESTVQLPDVEELGELTRYPADMTEPVEMMVNTEDLRLRKGPTTDDDVILKMPLKAKVLVYNSTEIKDWMFIAYIKSETEVVYGWSCSAVGNERYIVMPSAESEPTSEAVSSAPVVSESTLSDDEVKKAIINHIKAVNDVENSFVGYLKLSDAQDESGFYTETITFGSAGEPAVYRKATNVKDTTELSDYLAKYMITSLVKEKMNIATVTETTETQTDKVIYYSGDKSGIYVHSEAMSYAELDVSSITVLSAKANAYVVTAKANYDGEEITYNITFQYKDEKFMISGYTTSAPEA